MNIAVTGATGLIGSGLVPLLTTAGNELTRLARAAQWDQEKGTIQSGALNSLDVVVHLAGENIAAGRWTSARKARIRDSRVKGTKLIADTLANLEKPPQVLISASAIGYYGDRAAEILREDSAPGKGFLADVCRQWEATTDPATRKGMRVVHLRTGVVLSREGGALQQMLPPFKLGLGGKIGSGTQYWSWIALDDLCSAIVHCIQATALHGPVNAVSPSPVTNREFTKILGRVLNRPTILPLPAFAARLALGEMADALLLSSARVEPAKLLASRFIFRHKDLEATLAELVAA